MRIPSSLETLADEGIIDHVVRPLMSGKEAEVFLVRSGGELRVAKVYKEAQNRSFKQRSQYTEGRKVRNSRDQRAMDKRTRHGRAEDEAAWRSAEVDVIYRLTSAGVRVPKPYHFIDGVLIMELITDADGDPAPRLGETQLNGDQARWVFDKLLVEVIRMLCAGIVHGDLSDFNVLMGAEGPVVIDFPQAVDAAHNQNARKLLLRDVDNLQRFLSRYLPNLPLRPLGQEMWDLYTRSLLTPETRLGGRFRAPERAVDTAAVLDLIGDANYDERRRREAHGLSQRGVPAPAPRRVEVVVTPNRSPNGQRGPSQRAYGGPSRNNGAYGSGSTVGPSAAGRPVHGANAADRAGQDGASAGPRHPGSASPGGRRARPHRHR